MRRVQLSGGLSLVRGAGGSLLGFLLVTGGALGANALAQTTAPQPALVNANLLPGASPWATEAPEASEAPEATEAPEASEAPEATEAPEASEAPEATEAPEASDAPEASEAARPEGSSSPNLRDTDDDRGSDEDANLNGVQTLTRVFFGEHDGRGSRSGGEHGD